MNSLSARPYVLAIGGFDPCGGAGILADAKTIEAHDAFALGAITANTIQTEDSFLTSKPESTDFIIAQIDTILARYPIAACKIGLTSSFDQLQAIIETPPRRRSYGIRYYAPRRAAQTYCHPPASPPQRRLHTSRS